MTNNDTRPLVGIVMGSNSDWEKEEYFGIR